MVNFIDLIQKKQNYKHRSAKDSSIHLKNQSIGREEREGCEYLHCRDQLPASRCTASAYLPSSSHLGRNCRTKVRVNLTVINLHCNKYERQVVSLMEITALKMSGVTQKGHTGRGGWDSLCLMYSSVQSGAFGTEIKAGRVRSRFAEVLRTSRNPLRICRPHAPRCCAAAANHH